MRRAAMLAAIILVGAGPLSAARLCRDGKGLFTPCIGAPPPAARNVTAPRADRHDAIRRTPAAPPLVARAKLCRDGKGLFTPCV